MTTGKKTTKKSGSPKEASATDSDGPAKTSPAKGKKASPATSAKDKAPARDKAPVKEVAKDKATAKVKGKKALVDEDALPSVDEDLAEDLAVVDDEFDLADLETDDEEPVPASIKKGPAIAKKPGGKGGVAAVAILGDEDEEFEAGEDEELDEDEEDVADGDEEGAKEGGAAKKGPAAAVKPKAPAAKRVEGAAEPEPAAVVPARRLTPEAKAKLNELIMKGVPLNEALRQAAQWETFVAPVREPTAVADRMRPAHRPAAGEPRERESTIDDLDAPPEEEFESSE